MLLTRWIISSLKEKTVILPLQPLVKTRQVAVGNKVLPDAHNVLYCTAAVAFVQAGKQMCAHDGAQTWTFKRHMDPPCISKSINDPVMIF